MTDRLLLMLLYALRLDKACGWVARQLESDKIHTHDWDYSPPTATGWGVVRCRSCGETDIY